MVLVAIYTDLIVIVVVLVLLYDILVEIQHLMADVTGIHERQEI